MQPEKVFKRYDIRGKYPEELDEELVNRMGKSIGSFVREEFGESIVVCRDNKESSRALKQELIDGITSTGVNVLDAGVGPTDFAAFHGDRENAVSVQVTSSHMPLNFNGLKFMYPEGNGFLNEDLNEVKSIFKKEDFVEGSGTVAEITGAEEDYIGKAVEEVEKIGSSFDRKIAVDTLGGASRNFLPEILERLGFEVMDIGKDREGVYRDPPNPEPGKLSELEEKVDEENCFLGAATDMDGDRVKIYFEGEWISGDDLFCVFAQLFSGNIVASVDTSDNLEEFSHVEYTRVGDPFVINKMIRKKSVLSGEPNGHYCFPQFVNYNSGILAAAIASSVDMEDLVEKVPERKVEKENIEFESREGVEKAMKNFHNYARENLDVISEVDGVKFSYRNCSVLVRPSGSSPVIRMKSEGEVKERASEGLNVAARFLRKE